MFKLSLVMKAFMGTTTYKVMNSKMLAKLLSRS